MLASSLSGYSAIASDLPVSISEVVEEAEGY